MEQKENQEARDLVHPDNAGFREKVTPKKSDELLLFRCTCGHAHFRHAGYMKIMLPFLRGAGQKEMIVDDRQVAICVKCKSAYVWVSEQMYDVTGQVDLAAWERTEKEAHKATGPGGQC